MADINQTVEISYTADISDLLKQIEQLPGKSKEEARKLSQEITNGLKETEKAAKKAASTNSKAMNRMSNDAKKAGRQFRQLKREASEIGRGMADLAILFGDAQSPLGELVTKIGLIGITAGTVLPVFQHMRTAIVALGASSAMATGGLTLLGGAAALLIANMSDGNEELERQKERIQQSEKAFTKYTDQLHKTRRESDKFAKSVLAARNALAELNDQVQLEALRLKAEIDPSLLGELAILEEKIAFKGIEAKVKGTFGKISEEMTKQIDSQSKAVVSATNRANAALRLNKSELSNVFGGLITPDDVRQLQIIESQIEKVGQATIKVKGIPTIITKHDLQRSQRLVKSIKDMGKEQGELNYLQTQQSTYLAESEDDQRKIISQMQENVKLEKEIEASKDKQNKSSEWATKNAERLNELLELQKNVRESTLKLEEERENTFLRQFNAIDKQERQFESLIEKQQMLIREGENEVDIFQALDMLYEKRVKLVEQYNQKSKVDFEKSRIQSLDKQLSQVKTLSDIRDILQEKYELEYIQIKRAQNARMEELNILLRQAKVTGDIQLISDTQLTINRERLAFEDQILQKRLEANQRIQQEEQKIRDMQIQGSLVAFDNIQKLYDTQFNYISDNFAAEKEAFDKIEEAKAAQAEADGRVYNARSFLQTKQGQEEAKTADKAFRMQQALAVAKIAMDAAQGAVNALATYGPILGPILAGTIAATAATQTAVVMNQQSPTASAHMGQPLAPDERTIRVLTGEAVIDRRTVQSLGGEPGIRQMQNGGLNKSDVIVLNTFKHFDRYNKSARRMIGNNRRGSGAY